MKFLSAKFLEAIGKFEAFQETFSIKNYENIFVDSWHVFESTRTVQKVLKTFNFGTFQIFLKFSAKFGELGKISES